MKLKLKARVNRSDAGTATLKYQLGYVRSVPLPRVQSATAAKVAQLGAEAIAIVAQGYCYMEESHFFIAPHIERKSTATRL